MQIFGAKNARVGESSLYKNKLNLFFESTETKRPTNPGKGTISGKSPCLLETRKDFREAIPIRSKTEVN